MYNTMSHWLRYCGEKSSSFVKGRTFLISVDLLEWRTRNTIRVEHNNMGLFVNRHYESTWFEVKDHGN